MTTRMEAQEMDDFARAVRDVLGLEVADLDHFQIRVLRHLFAGRSMFDLTPMQVKIARDLGAML